MAVAAEGSRNARWAAQCVMGCFEDVAVKRCVLLPCGTAECVLQRPGRPDPRRRSTASAARGCGDICAINMRAECAGVAVVLRRMTNAAISKVKWSVSLSLEPGGELSEASLDAISVWLADAVSVRGSPRPLLQLRPVGAVVYVECLMADPMLPKCLEAITVLRRQVLPVPGSCSHPLVAGGIRHSVCRYASRQSTHVARGHTDRTRWAARPAGNPCTALCCK